MMNSSQAPQPVKATERKTKIQTYGVGSPEKNPMFFEKRVYQCAYQKLP
jgi:hypothetical protein